MLLHADSRLDDSGVVNVRDQANDEVMLANLSIQCLVVVDVERDGGRMLDTSGEGLGRLEGSAGCGVKR